MTKHLPPETLRVYAALPTVPRAAALTIFKDHPAWMVQASLAALADLRPGLGIAVEPEWLATHLWKWPRDDVYFAGVCALLRSYSVGGA